MRVHISTKWSNLNITTTTTITTTTQRCRKYILYKPSYSPFCLKFCCHGNRGRSKVNRRKRDKEGKSHFTTEKKERKVKTVCQRCCLRCRMSSLLLWHHAGTAALWVIMCTAWTEGRTESLDYLTSIDVHYDHLGGDNKRHMFIYSTYQKQQMQNVIAYGHQFLTRKKEKKCHMTCRKQYTRIFAYKKKIYLVITSCLVTLA